MSLLKTPDIAIGRNIAGVLYGSGYTQGLLLGEQVAIIYRSKKI